MLERAKMRGLNREGLIGRAERGVIDLHQGPPAVHQGSRWRTVEL